MATIKESELRALLAEVEQEIGGLLKTEQTKLAKAASDMPEETPGEDHAGSPPASAPPPSAEGSAATSGEDPGNPAESPGTETAPEASSPAPEAAGPEAPAAPGQEGGDEESLKAEYIKLGQEDPEALKAHYLACAEALQSIMGSQEGSAPASPEASSPPPAESAPMAPAAKMELADIAPDKLGDGKDRLADIAPGTMKSEKDERIDSLEKSLESVVGALDKFLGSPLRKAVTSVAAVAKPGEVQDGKTWTRIEAMKALGEKAKGNLKKSDRERINQFAVQAIGIDQIKDLLV